jgi:hypothetical protein
MNLRDQVRRAVVPAVLRYYQWRGDPVARWFRPADKANPYPLYDDIRGRGSLVRSRLGAWVTASHATAETILRDRRFSSSPAHAPGYQEPSYGEGDPRAELPGRDLLTMDPPDHTRVRRLFSGALTPKSVADLEPWIRQTVSELLDAADPAGFDLIGALAFPLPLAVICRLLGVPIADRDRFREWGHAIAATLEPQTTAQIENDRREANVALARYLRDLIGQRRAQPDDSLLSALIAAEEEGDRLSPDELVATALLLLVAGFETTVNLIGNGTVALLREREQWEKLVADPSLAAEAVDEILRLDSPVQATSRFATTEVEVDGTVLRKGTAVMVALGGANRDPGLFGEPERLRIGRPDAARHLSFSLGIHHCPGANLARLEGRIALEELARRYPDLQLSGTPARRPLLILRGFEHVPVRAQAS